MYGRTIGSGICLLRTVPFRYSENDDNGGLMEKKVNDRTRWDGIIVIEVWLRIVDEVGKYKAVR
jgi:hypothetical protein